jgi:hypothetical protein
MPDSAVDPQFDLTRAPFCVIAGADAAQAAEEIAACFEVVAGLPGKLTRAAHAAMSVIGIAPDAAVARAAEALAAEIDAGVGDGRANPYHNSQHYCEVMLSALYLSAHAGLRPDERARMVAAALAHDFHHDGRTSIGMPFRLERLAAQAAAPYFEMAGVAAGEVAHIVTLVLATETTVGVPFARQCHAHFAAGAALPDALASEPRLDILREDARLAMQAVLLAEADLLPSVGLTVYYGELTQANLAREWNRSMTAVDKVFFLEKIFGDFVVGRFFSPNVARLKDAMRRKAEAIAR